MTTDLQAAIARLTADEYPVSIGGTAAAAGEGGLVMADFDVRVILMLLAKKRHYPYRMGVLQAAVLLGVITNEQWGELVQQVARKVKEPKL